MGGEIGSFKVTCWAGLAEAVLFTGESPMVANL
jgi:hypothetical protein